MNEHKIGTAIAYATQEDADKAVRMRALYITYIKELEEKIERLEKELKEKK